MLKEDIEKEYFNSLEFSLNVGCKNRCTFCPQDLYLKNYIKYSNKNKNMRLQDFDIMINNLLESNVSKIVFAGYSENFLNPQAIDIIKLALKNDFKVSIITSGIGLDYNKIDELSKLNIHRFTFSLHSSLLKKENLIYNPLIRIILYSLTIFKNIQAVIVLKEKLKNHYLIEFCKQYNIQYRIDWHDRAGNLNSDPQIRNNKIKKAYCSRPLTPVVQPNGEISLCCMDWSLRHNLGNLLNTSYLEIINNQTVKRILNKLYRGDLSNLLCFNCHYLESIDEFWEPISIRMRKKYGN